MRTLILFLSDIHFRINGAAENQGKVINAFLEDVPKLLSKINYDDLYVIITGDLVHAADNYNNYEGFYETIIKSLQSSLSLDYSHFIVIPGNHDVQQSLVKECKNIYFPVVESIQKESIFNDTISNESTKGIFTKQFSNFKKFVVELMGYKDFDEVSNIYDLDNGWTIFAANSSIGSFAHVDEKNDKGVLGVDTRKMNEWINNNKNKKKILLMHHPLDWLREWASSEVKELISSNIDLVLTGHTHEQDLINHVNKEQSFIHAFAPQLFTDKEETLGYCIISIEEDYVEKIIYRQWVKHQNKFSLGINFVLDEEDGEYGTISFRTKESNIQDNNTDKVKIIYENRLFQAMNSYKGFSANWIDRYVSDQRVDRTYRFDKLKLISESELINDNKSFQIIAPHEFGFTCYAFHFLLSLWTSFEKFGVYIDCQNLLQKKFQVAFETQLAELGKKAVDVDWIVLDNWDYPRKSQADILRFLNAQYPQAKLLLLCPRTEAFFNENEDLKVLLPKINVYYFVPMQHAQMREMIASFSDKTSLNDNTDILLQRMDDNIQNFNLHRTPFSCITLLVVYSHFTDPIVNRTEVIERALHVLFDKSELPTYQQEKPDMKDCEYVLGYFCANLIIPEKDSSGKYPSVGDGDRNYMFTKDTFITTLKKFCKDEGITIVIEDLFSILEDNGIIIRSNSTNYYSFRLSVWVYYFASTRLSKDKDFYDYIMNNQNYMHYSDILEFYTGKDRSKVDAVGIVNEDLTSVIDSVKTKIGLKEEVDLFGMLRWKRTTDSEKKIIEVLNSTLENSNLPAEIKDSIADHTYNPAVAFNQSLYKVWINYSVGHLFNLINVASKVFRNSYYVDKNKKTELLQTIITAWKLFSQIFFLSAPALARYGKINLEGMSFILDDSFNNVQDEKKVIAILVAIPDNLLSYFKDNLYTVRMSGIILENFKSETDKVKKHLFAFLLIKERPQGWFEAIKEYIGTITNGSYFMGTLFETMMDDYQLESDETNAPQLKLLCRTILFKEHYKKMPDSVSELNKKIKLLSLRSDDDEDKSKSDGNNPVDL